MPNRLRYAPLPDPPHMPLEQLRRRLAPYLSEPDADGHVLWTGARGDGDGVLRVRRPQGHGTLSASRLVWAAAGHGWMAPPAHLRRNCGFKQCMAVAHLTPVHVEQLRQLTDEQVAEARQLYWQQGTYRGGRLRTPHHRADALQQTAWRLGITRTTVQRVVAGERVFPHLWRTEELTADEVRRTYEQIAAQRAATPPPALVTQGQLARRYGISESCMNRVLTGLSYQHVPMPKRRR